MEDVAARYRHGGGGIGGDGVELPHGGRESVVGRTGVPHPHRVNHLHYVGGRFQWFHDHDRRSRRINHHDNSGRRIHHDVNLTIDVVHRRCRTSTRPDGPDADARQLDQPDVHDDCCGLEHRLGFQMRPRTCRRTIVPGIRDPGRVIAQRNPCNHRDRTNRTIGHRRRPLLEHRRWWCRPPRPVPGWSRSPARRPAAHTPKTRTHPPGS